MIEVSFEFDYVAATEGDEDDRPTRGQGADSLSLTLVQFPFFLGYEVVALLYVGGTTGLVSLLLRWLWGC